MNYLKHLSIVGLGLVAFEAYAHTQLSSSVPADRAVVAVAPDEIVLTFSTDVRLTALDVVDRGGQEQAIGALPTAAQKVFAIAVSELPAGDYVVNWRAVGADTHIVSGEVHFTVATS